MKNQNKKAAYYINNKAAQKKCSTNSKRFTNYKTRDVSQIFLEALDKLLLVQKEGTR